jgi:hypothetical protein
MRIYAYIAIINERRPFKGHFMRGVPRSPQGHHILVSVRRRFKRHSLQQLNPKALHNQSK